MDLEADASASNDSLRSAASLFEREHFHHAVIVERGRVFGVVSDRSGAKRYRVVFSFHLRKFSDTLSVTALEFVANVLEKVRKSRQTGAREVVLRHQLHRKPSRHVEGSARRH